MAADSPRKRLWAETTCSICLDFFTDPVTLDCGHNFCKGCILKCWEKPPSPTLSCPQCRETISQKVLRPNWQLANVVDLIKQLNDQAPKEAVAGGVCGSHQEPLKFFCMDDEAPICVVCERSKCHREHRVVPVEEAVQDCKDQICVSLENLKKKKEELLASKENTEKQSQDLLNMIKKERERTGATFRDLRQFLEEEENLLLAQMEEVDKEIAKKRDEDIVRLSEELSSLEKTIEEMEEKCRQPPCEFLKGILRTLRRGEQRQKTFDIQVGFPPSLKWRAWKFWEISPVLQNAAENFKDTLKSDYQQHKETVTLDPETAHPQLLISEDRKCVTLGDAWQTLPYNIWRFVYHQCVLGSPGFESGRHCWEVDVGQEEGWAIGICAGHYPNDKAEALGPGSRVWAFGKWDGQYRFVIPPLNPPLVLREEPKKIRVSLNYMGQQVAFFDADTAALICAYSVPSHCSSTFYPFFWLGRKSCFRLAS